MIGIRVDRLRHEAVREALALLGVREPPTNRAAALRALREELRGYGAVRGLVDRAPGSAATAFARLAHEGPLSVEALLGRGWWGHGALPPPLDWLQRRALIQVGEEGLVHATTEAREGFLDQALWSPENLLQGPDGGPAPEEESDDAAPAVEPTDPRVRVERAGSVVVAPDPSALHAAVAVGGAGLRVIAPTVAVSARSAATVTAALRSAGVALLADVVVPAAAAEPALPGTPESAVGPRAVRALLGRAVTEQRQVRLQYFASSRGGAATDRVVDPWSFRDDLLSGYCHLRAGERTFAVDRVGRALLLSSPVQVAADDDAG
jgi:hypothetical protein